MLKQNVTDLTNATAIINQLHPKVYNYDTLQFGYMALAKGQQFGLLAQELDSVLPQFVKPLVQPAVKDSSGNIIYQELNFKGVTYGPLITLLLAGFQEQQQQIINLQTQLINCCGAPRPLSPSQDNDEKTGAIEVKLTNGENSILYQNEPNPYTSSTTIRFFIPENTMNVKITFQDATGKTIKEVPISETGQGSINVDGSDLISGTYTYSLVVSGRVIDTKKMVKVK